MGVFFLCLQGLVVARNLLSGYPYFYWYCDFAPLLFAMLFFAGNTQAIKGLAYIGLIPQWLFIISFTSLHAFGRAPFGFVFDQHYGVGYTLATLLMHLASTVALFATLRVRSERTALAYALAFVYGMYITVALLTSPSRLFDYDFNYIYFLDALSFVPFYTAFWIPLVFVGVVLPAYGFETLLHRLQVRRGVHLQPA